MLTQRQQEMRADGLGSSSWYAIVAGHDGFQSALDVYLRHPRIAQLAPQEAPHLRMGHVLEAPVAKEVAARTGWTLRKNGRTYRDKARPWLMATPDYFKGTAPRQKPLRGVGWRREGLAEIKTTIREEEYGPEGGQEIPARVLTQCTGQMLVTGIHDCTVAVLLLRSREIRLYRVEYSERLAEVLADRVSEFWHKHILAHEPPEIDARSESAHRFLAAEYREAGALVVPAPEGALRWARLAHEASEREKAAAADKEEAYAYLKAYVGDDRGIEGPGFRFLWYPRAGSVDYRALCETLLKDRTDDEVRALLDAHTHPGSRSVRLSWHTGDGE